MLTTSEQLAADQIIDWLETTPNAEEILYYVRHFPADKEYILAEAARQYGRILFEEKYTFFKSKNCEYFVEKITEVDQFIYLDWLRDYNASSVIPNIQKQYPEFVGQFPETVMYWAKNFLERWLSLTFLATASEFENCSVYARSFIGGQFSDSGLQEIDQYLRNILLEMGKRYDSREPKETAQVEQERTILKSLGFFPDEYIERLIKDNLSDEESSTLLRIIKVISALLAFGIEKVRADIEVFFDAFYELLRSEYDEKCIAMLESWRVTEMAENSDLEVVSSVLTGIWTLENLQANTVQSLLNEYYGKITDSQKQVFREYIYVFVNESTLLDYIVDPLTVDFLLTCLETIRDDNTFRTFIAQMEERRHSPAQPATFEAVLRAFWYITTNFPRSEQKTQSTPSSSVTLTQPV